MLIDGINHVSIWSSRGSILRTLQIMEFKELMFTES